MRDNLCNTHQTSKMEVLKFMLLALVVITTADDWTITVEMSPVPGSIINTVVSVTFYERAFSGSSPAPNVTMEINATTSAPSVTNTSIPTIDRPVKIDVWDSGDGQVTDLHLLQLWVENLAFVFTFQCNCILGRSDNKTTLFPTEDNWEIEITTAAKPWWGDSVNHFYVTIRDFAGVSQTFELYNGEFYIDTTVTSHRRIHLEHLVSYTIWSVERNDHWECKKVVFIKIATCQTFTFECGAVNYHRVTKSIFSTGLSQSCLTKDTTVAVTTTSPTITSTASTPATLSSTDTPTTRTTDIFNSNAPLNTTDTTQLPCCPCVHNNKPPINLTISQLQMIVKELVIELSVNKSTLSATIRKKTCATDSRPSSKVIGMTGAAFLAIPFVFMVVVDCTRAYMYMQN